MGRVNEKDGRLEVTVPDSGKSWEDWYWSQAGYVTKYAYSTNEFCGSNQGFEASVNVVELDGVAEMVFLVSDQKITDRDPVNATNWYMINKVFNTKYPHENLIRVVNRIDGNVSWIVQEPWLSPTGQLKIKVSTGSISFFENGVLRYAEPYAFASNECYIYIYTSTWGKYAGTDSFDNFAVQPCREFRDDFSDGKSDGWTIDNGTWQVHSNQINTQNQTSHIHVTTPFSVNRHVRADIQTLYSNGANSSVAQLMVKEQDGNNYVSAYIATDGTVTASIIYGGVEENIRAPSSLSPFDRHSIAVSIAGDNIKVWVDGQKYIDQSNMYLPYLAGYTGLYCVNAQASFGYVAVLN